MRESIIINMADGKRSTCSMVGLLGILIQVALGVLSFSVLIFKRYRENPQRPWNIWLMDTSKQVISQLLAHFINLTISLALASSDTDSDECLWYLVTNVLDNTLGVLFCVGCLMLIETQFRKKRKFSFISGNYYSISTKSEQYGPDVVEMGAQQVIDTTISRAQGNQLHEDAPATPGILDDTQPIQPDDTQRQQTIPKIRIDYKAWLVQLSVWNGIVVVNKAILFGFEFGLEKQLMAGAYAALGWVEKNPALELVVVIVVVPVFMNGLAFWIQDNFLMKKTKLSENQNLLTPEKQAEIYIV